MHELLNGEAAMANPNMTAPHADLRLLRPEEAMEVLQISRRTLQELTSKGSLPSVLVARKCRRYPADGLRRWLAARMEGGANG